MYRKPIKNLSARQKRNLKQQISRSIKRTFDSNLIQQGRTEDCSISNSKLISSTVKTGSAQNIPNEGEGTPCNLPNNSALDFDYYTSDATDDAHSECSCVECSNSSNTNSTEFHEDLKNWAVECNIPLNHTSKLLQILKKQFKYSLS